ncbi:TonB-dependent receptor [Asticcacaulis sp. EMRT-3]|uniref:TonB-dependent receptor n=1 Tax=Asticcacaulis sp. EMRT-3 TaxID=3040349 RepID=UPI0024AF34DE|nr:TonB-dependent receptor [Asticcacaulis sp. EMRT-3]MDI7776486.1 TonB-dependent receptor [Asticcacaulis sp. EMRT-3]
MKTESSNAIVASGRRRASLYLGASFGVLFSVLAGAAMAQDAAPAAPAADDSTVVIVTGFRGSLQSALSAKRKSDAIVDVIKSEDIAQFPDNNLAEALQRIPGVAIDRDGGEGRTITVRGLGPDFTRVRLNGMEALATTGGKDSSGGTNRGRGFDFSVFAAELFQSVTVRKSPEAATEEGSLGATVDLQAPHPFDYKGFTMGGGLQMGYNDLSKNKSPKGSFLISNRWDDGKLGALFSVAYSDKTEFEEGPSTTRWENAYSPSSVDRFGAYSTDGGKTFIPIKQCAKKSCDSGKSTQGLPATGDPLADALSNALHPRIPRYGRLTYHQKRLGLTGSFQMKPTPDTTITLDALYSDFVADRDEQYLEAISFSRAGTLGKPTTGGVPNMQVYDYTIDSQGNLIKGSFNNTDIRTENRHDALETQFGELALTWDQNIGDHLKLKGYLGASKSTQMNPEQTTLSFDAYDVQGYSYDFTDEKHPVFTYGTSHGCSVDQACYWQMSDSTALGDASLVRLRPNTTKNDFGTASLSAIYDFDNGFKIEAGVQSKKYSFSTSQFWLADSTEPLPSANGHAASNLLNADLLSYSQPITAFGTTWLMPDLAKIDNAIHYNCNCVNQYGDFRLSQTTAKAAPYNQAATERDGSSYVQADFNHDVFGINVRGNLGVRYVTTDQTVQGIQANKAGTSFTHVTTERKYSDTLPALNIIAEPIDNVLIRFAASKVMARPTMQSLVPNGTLDLTAGTPTWSGGNPNLNPIRATDYDLNAEWYWSKDALISGGLFYKDITSYIQTLSYTGTLADLGVTQDQLDAQGYSQLSPDTSATIKNPVNTPGGILRGWEFNVQDTFSFLPWYFKNLGGVFNYTHVDSTISYYTSASTTKGVIKANLLGMSPNSWNTTLYYQDSKFEARITASHRDKYLQQLNPGSGAAFQGKNGITDIDAQITYNLTKHLTLTFQGINLTNVPDSDSFDYYDTAQGNTDSNAMLEYLNDGRQYYVGIRYKY